MPHLQALGATAAPRILIAEDDDRSRHLLEVILRREGYAVESVADGRASVEAAVLRPPDLILLDIHMPRMDGFGVVRSLRARHEFALLPVILVTAMHAAEDKVRGLDAGATDFVTKPYDRAELLARIRSALRTRDAADRLEDAQGVLVALASAIEAKDAGTGHHCARLASYAVAMARLAGLAERMVEAVAYGAALHDVGKIGIPEQLLRKPTSLTPGEWVQMRMHPEIGARIVAPLRLGRLVAPIVLGHHERWDGTGYPAGLQGRAIPLGARIVAVVDSFDAIVEGRPYRAARSVTDALDELERGRYGQFDPHLARLFIEHVGAITSVGVATGLDGVRGLQMLRAG